jgi:hypothetical protein
MPRTPAEALTRLVEALDRLEIPYAVAGSVASSAHGIPRTTLDVDLVVDLAADKIDEFASDLQGDFYVDADLIRESFARGRAANLIHLVTAWKFDLFPLRKDEYSRTEFGRRSFREIQPDGAEKVECAVASGEDTVLRKLEWYRAGGESSERQWNDLLGVCRTLGARLDVLYLRRWASHLKVDDLLERLLSESGIPSAQPER